MWAGNLLRMAKWMENNASKGFSLSLSLLIATQQQQLSKVRSFGLPINLLLDKSCARIEEKAREKEREGKERIIDERKEGKRKGKG